LPRKGILNGSRIMTWEEKLDDRRNVETRISLGKEARKGKRGFVEMKKTEVTFFVVMETLGTSWGRIE